jgi:hypothetical protein
MTNFLPILKYRLLNELCSEFDRTSSSWLFNINDVVGGKTSV